MKPFPKKITFFLIDGDASGRISAELSNWNGITYKIPRTLIKQSVNREDLYSTGVYFLFGKNPENEEKDLVYIGEAESILDRLKQHLGTKEFWIEAVCVFSKNLNKAHVKYLEKRLFDLAKEANRYELENATIPAKTSISEADQAEMEEFLENVKLTVHTLGFKLFERIDKRQTQSIPSQSQDYAISTKGIKATGFLTSEGFVVKQGSQALSELAPSMEKWAKGYLRLREKLIIDGILKKEGENYIFTSDQLFSSPSAGAVIVMGRNANGMTEWKDENGKSLAENEAIE
ncbi:GIY-YIG nuclease family protein [Leptospira levettii]|uniref:GIY-YIG nuclease family protein n=1 Tax=Leptospira levettii TaxID=2023178 RepID=A0AAW5VBB3_9LEPT|nr:GIY-YIG nuclease family protein [Leptospira levettii]MCW7512107.1 GIY-YIG nuclease family protein [Leptospira levettii]MCW7517154.1 GIY-YIG nuclease family protein [Leptospira levettii]